MARLLLIDDDLDYTDVIRARMQKAGYQIETCPGCEEAAELLEKDKKFDVIILDLEMPARNGMATLTYLRNHFTTSEQPEGFTIPIIVATGLQSERLREIVLTQKVADYILKPFDTSLLIEKVEAVLKKK